MVSSKTFLAPQCSFNNWMSSYSIKQQGSQAAFPFETTLALAHCFPTIKTTLECIVVQHSSLRLRYKEIYSPALTQNRLTLLLPLHYPSIDIKCNYIQQQQQIKCPWGKEQCTYSNKNQHSNAINKEINSQWVRL